MYQLTLRSRTVSASIRDNMTNMEHRLLGV